MKNNESQQLPDKAPKVKVYGQRAVKKVLDLRFDDIISLLLDESLKKTLDKEWSAVLKLMAKASKPYNFVQKNQLDALAKSKHHEGFLIFVRDKAHLTFAEWTKNQAKIGIKTDFIFVLVGIKNPHNLGAILRNAAFFGVKTVILSDCAKISLSSLRISEGGAEHLELIEDSRLQELVAYFSDGKYSMVGTSSHAKKSLKHFTFTKKTAIFFGEEKDGLPQFLLDRLDDFIAIKGSDAIESLNVSATTAVVAFEWSRQCQINL